MNTPENPHRWANIPGVKYPEPQQEQPKRKLPPRERVNAAPDGYVTTEQALKLLKISRSSLFRYGKKGLLHPFPAVMKTKQGERVGYFYSGEDIARFIQLMNDQNANTKKKRALVHTR